MVCYSFLIRLFHSLLFTGLNRRFRSDPFRESFQDYDDRCFLLVKILKAGEMLFFGAQNVPFAEAIRTVCAHLLKKAGRPFVIYSFFRFSLLVDHADSLPLKFFAYLSGRRVGAVNRIR